MNGPHCLQARAKHVTRKLRQEGQTGMHAPCLLVVVAACVHTVCGYSDGKVSKACSDMVPQHHGSEPSPDPPPYTITTDTLTFSPGDRITVTLQAAPTSHTTYFKGFLIEARDASKPSSSSAGSFMLVDPAVSQRLACGHIKGSGVSHTDSSNKETVHAVWEAPENPLKKIQFFVTVVRKYNEYWVRIPGPVVTLKGAMVGPTRAVTTTVADVTTTTASLTTPFSADGCGSSKSCLREPAGCRPEVDPACFFLSFTADTTGLRVLFELSAAAEGYIAFALSLDKWMGNDDVYLCVRNEDNVKISPSYVSGRTHPELAPEGALLNQAWRLSDGFIQCHFRRNIILSQENRFNLNQSYFLFLAHGKADNGFIQKHARQPLISTSQIVITGPTEDLTGSRSPMLVKFHGVLMLTAWMWIVSTGVLFARHFRHHWPDATLLGQKLWFQVHRSLMALAVCLTSVAFTLPFLYRGGWSKHAGAHQYIGCSVMVLSLIQPIMAALRPAPESPRRCVFNWLHLGAGSVAQILAVACVFLGVRQQALLLPWTWATCMLTGWLLWLVLTDIVLLLHSHFPQRISGMNDSEGSRLLAKSERENRAQVLKFKTVMLIVFQLGNVAFLAPLVHAITNL